MNLKDKARSYFTAVNEYDALKVEEMVCENYIQHNPRVPTGRQAFIDFLPVLKSQKSRINNQRILQDGNYIIMHHVWQNARPFGVDEMIAFHVIRFDSDKKIAEHWNVGIENQKLNPSGRSLVCGETKVTDLDLTEGNRQKIVQLFKAILLTGVSGYSDVFSHFFDKNLKQHHPLISDGVDSFLQALKMGVLNIEYQKLHKVFAEGNFVLAISEGFLGVEPTAFYDLFRLSNEKIVEHWSVYQESPSTNLANDNTMFGF